MMGSWRETTYSICSGHVATDRMGAREEVMDTCGLWAQVCFQGVGGEEAIDLLLLDLSKQPAG